MSLDNIIVLIIIIVYVGSILCIISSIVEKKILLGVISIAVLISTQLFGDFYCQNKLNHTTECSDTIIEECNTGKVSIDNNYDVLKTDTSEENGKLIIINRNTDTIYIFSKEKICKKDGGLK